MYEADNGAVNLDGMVNFQDVSYFIDALTSDVYQAQADCNEDGYVNFMDITPFIYILANP